MNSEWAPTPSCNSKLATLLGEQQKQGGSWVRRQVRRGQEIDQMEDQRILFFLLKLSRTFLLFITLFKLMVSSRLEWVKDRLYNYMLMLGVGGQLVVSVILFAGPLFALQGGEICIHRSIDRSSKNNSRDEVHVTSLWPSLSACETTTGSQLATSQHLCVTRYIH